MIVIELEEKKYGKTMEAVSKIENMQSVLQKCLRNILWVRELVKEWDIKNIMKMMTMRIMETMVTEILIESIEVNMVVDTCN